MKKSEVASSISFVALLFIVATFLGMLTMAATNASTEPTTHSGMSLGLAFILVCLVAAFGAFIAEAYFRHQEKEERFSMFCGFFPKAAKDGANQQKVTAAMSALNAAVAEAVSQLNAIEATDALKREAQQAYLDIRKQQLREMLQLATEFEWI